MITVTLVFYTPISDLTGEKKVTLSFNEPVNLDEVIRKITRRYGEKFSRYFYNEEGVFHPQCLVLVNGQYSIEPSRLLSDGDEISFIPPVAGG